MPKAAFKSRRRLLTNQISHALHLHLLFELVLQGLEKVLMRVVASQV